jgi:hypothetical protein
MVTFLKDSGVKTFEGMGICVEFNPEMEVQEIRPPMEGQRDPQPFRDPVDQDE